MVLEPVPGQGQASVRVAGGEAWRLYEYITRHFIATVSYDCKYLQSTIAFRIGSEHFTCTGKTVISPGTAAHPTVAPPTPPQTNRMFSVIPGEGGPVSRV